MMRKVLFLTVLLFSLAGVMRSQQLSVKSFKLAEGDISALTDSCPDTNGGYCALIKVGVALDGVQFTNGVLRVLHKPGEYWVYLAKNISALGIYHNSYTPLTVDFHTYGIGRVEAGATYIMTLEKPQAATASQYQTLKIRFSPSNASVLVDNKFVKSSNGTATAKLSVGQHSYVVACDGYESEEGTVKLKSSAPSNLQITLTKEASNTSVQSVVMPQVSSSSQQVISSSSSSGFSSSSLSSGSNIISIPVKNGISIDMVRVEAGTFMMGATSEMQNPWDNEKPVHQVTLTNDYYIGKYEVTQALWWAVMGSNPSNFKGENHPVKNVSWNDCHDFIRMLNILTGKHFRLPTEAEWEYAARGGRKSKGYQYSGSNSLSDIAWYADNSGSTTHAVGTKEPNELGIYDMSGNVWEWCQDWYDSYTSSSQTNPTGAASGSRRVFRGGSWLYYAGSCRSSNRYDVTPDYRSNNLGFRLVLSE